ncbi:MAG: asparagine synthase [Bacteroidales bacterium]|nr:asparagine synthase [Bacteroidales bacterium]
MMVRVELKYNHGFVWDSESDCHFKGYFFHKNHLYNDVSILISMDNKNIRTFQSFLKEVNGMYSLVINEKNFTLAAVDPTRTFPLFYTKIENDFWISDSVEFLINTKRHVLLNNAAAAEFLQTGYTTGNQTLIKDISQIQAGEVIWIENEKLSTAFYHQYLTKQFSNNTSLKLEIELTSILKSVFNRLVSTLENKTILIPLSGGYDSRLIAVMLKDLGFKNVICYTYGRKYKNEEIAISEKVAKKLNFDWHFIEYNDSLIDNYLESRAFQKYYPFSSNYVSMFFMQEYFAVLSLKENGILENKSVFIPGHSGDFLGGSHLNFIDQSISDKKLIKTILHHNYCLTNSNRVQNREFYKSIDNSLLEMGNFENYQLFENWDMKERQAKFIVNSANVYNFFDYEHRLPFWDKELIDFFNKLPFTYKKHKVLYDKVLKGFFSHYQLNFANELQVTPYQLYTQSIKAQIKRIIPDFTKHKRMYELDWALYHEITKKMIDSVAKTGKPTPSQYNQYNAIICWWYLLQIKDKHNF